MNGRSPASAGFTSSAPSGTRPDGALRWSDGSEAADVDRAGHRIAESLQVRATGTVILIPRLQDQACSRRARASSSSSSTMRHRREEGGTAYLPRSPGSRHREAWSEVQLAVGGIKGPFAQDGG